MEGNVTADGNGTVTKGFIYGTNSASVTAATVGVLGGMTSVEHGTVAKTTGAYDYQLTGLADGTEYFFKSYATNVSGSSYGTVSSFTTTTPCPTGFYVYGSYLGDGNAQSITGIGFSPDVLLVIPDGEEGWVSTSTMGATECKLAGASNSALVTTRMTSLDGDGFTVQDAASTSGKVYYFAAFTAVGGNINVGSLVGTASTQLVNVGYEPRWVWVLGDRGNYADFASMLFESYDSQAQRLGKTDFPFGSAYIINNTMDANGFTLNSNGDGVQTGTDYHYVTFKANTDVIQGSYAGDGTASRSIPVNGGADWEPQIAFTKRRNDNQMVARIASMPEGDSYLLTGSKTSSMNSFYDKGFINGAAAGDEFINGPASTYDFMVFKGGTLLPVNMISFSGKRVDETVVLNWVTASEINSSHFVVERAGDNGIFVPTGRVKAAGSSLVNRYYEFIDENPLDGDNYYRLKQVDFNGSYDHYRTVVVNMSTGASITRIHTYPNPTSSNVNLEFEVLHPREYTITLTDAAGRVLQSEINSFNEGNIRLSFDVSEFEVGLYFYVIQADNGPRYYSKFLKQ